MRKVNLPLITKLKFEMVSSVKAKRTGRPAKFAEPSRPVTVTLPERILDLLAAVDSDRAQAIVKAVEAISEPHQESPRLVEKVRISKDRAILLVGNSEYLRRLPWLRLIAVGPGRHLISIHSGTSVETIELGLQDLLESLPAGARVDREILEALLGIVRASRRTRSAKKEEILFVGHGK
jgi:hypothetical protein